MFKQDKHCLDCCELNYARNLTIYFGDEYYDVNDMDDFNFLNSSGSCDQCGSLRINYEEWVLRRDHVKANKELVKS